MVNKKLGFTMVELLVVLVIIAILAAVAAPIYLANVKRARASEAVATMSLVRQALRDYQINHATYFDVADTATTGSIQLPLPTTVAAGVPTPSPSGLDIPAGTAQYFSSSAFSVDATSPDSNGASGKFATPPVQDFLITVDGSKSTLCSGVITNCATKQIEINNARLEMDNSGRMFVSYDAGTTWEVY